MDTISKIDTELCTEALKTEPEQMKKCPHCGKSFVWFDRKLKNINIHIQVPDCNCVEEIEKRKKFEAIEAAKKERLARLFENSMMTPFFKEKTFDKLNSSKEHFSRCYQYAQKFHPLTATGIQMIGGVGTGKTTLLAAICNELIKQGFSCLFTTLSSLLDKFSKYSYDNAGDISPLLNWLTEFDFIVLDDIGRETYTEKRKETAFRIVDTLLNYKKITAFTANPEMINKLKNIPEWAATLDRLKDTCGILLQFEGSSMRGKNA